MDIRNAMESQLFELDKKLSETKSEYGERVFPDGNLIVNKNGNYYKFYNSKDGARTLIPSSQKELIQKLAMKKFFLRRIDAYEKEMHAIKRYLSTLPVKTEEDLVRAAPIYKELLKPLLGDTFDMSAWEMQEYDKCEDYPEDLIIDTIKGDKVRSKSEAIIADELFRSKIPYRYECSLIVGNTLMHPDFTAINVRTREIFIWEHFGKADDEGYLNRNCINKMNKYLHAGYIPTINMITTYETMKEPFNSIKAQSMIKEYLM